MSWVAVGVTAASAIGGALSASSQKSGAAQAAAAQTAAQQATLNFNSGIYNADTSLTSGSRELGGLAQNQLAYDMGLSPNLNVSSDFTTPQVSSSGQVTYNPTTGAPTVAGTVNQAGSNVPITAGGTGATTAATNGTFGGAGNSNTSGSVVATPQVATSTGTSLAQSTGGGTASTTGVNPTTGTGSYGSLGNVLSASTFQQDPAYQWNLQQGTAALQRQEAAGGTQLSGSALKDAMTYASGLASNEYQNEFNNSLNAQAQQFNMLNSVAGNVNTANGQIMNAGTNATSTASSANTNIGNAQANQATADANANSSLINSITGGITGGIKSNFGSTSSTPSTTSTPSTYGTGTGSALNDPNYFSTSNIQPTITNGYTS